MWVESEGWNHKFYCWHTCQSRSVSSSHSLSVFDAPLLCLAWFVMRKAATKTTAFISQHSFLFPSLNLSIANARDRHTCRCPKSRATTSITCTLSRRDALIQIAATAAALQFSHTSVSAEEQPSCPATNNDDNNDPIDPCADKPQVSDAVELWIRVGTSPARRVELALFGCVVPNTVANFKQLVANGDYNETSIYRIVPSLTIQMGDVLHNDGASGRSSAPDGRPLEAENFRITHSCPGVVSMARTRNGLIDSRFFITTRMGDSYYLDGKYVAFGLVSSGLDTLIELDRLAGSANKPKLPVTIERASIISVVPSDALPSGKI